MAAVRNSRTTSTHSAPSRLEQFDRIAGRVVEQDLRAALAGDDLVAGRGAARAESLGLGLEVVDGELEPAPSTGLRDAAIGRRLRGSTRSTDHVEHQPQR